MVNEAVKHMSIMYQLTDIFTNGHTATRFQVLRSKFMVRQLPD